LKLVTTSWSVEGTSIGGGRMLVQAGRDASVAGSSVMADGAGQITGGQLATLRLIQMCGNVAA